MEDAEIINVCGSCCPVPLIRLRAAANRLDKGKVVCITGDDPLFESSVHDFCHENRFVVLSVEQQGRATSIKIQL